jgi:hypothetical protein
MVLLLAAGCIDTTVMIAVRQDGSGLMMETIYIDPDFESTMNSMATEMGMSKTEGKAEVTLKDRPIDEEKYRDKALRMGEGVQFLSAKHILRADGAPGERIVYSFEDIRKLVFEPRPEDLNPMEEGGGGFQAATEDSDPLLFDFIEGDPSRLIIIMPREERKDKAEPEDRSQATVNPTGDFEEMAQFFKGLRFRVIIKILEGEIIQTNAVHVEEGAASDRKQVVTLFDFDFGALMEDKTSFEKLNGLNEIGRMSEAMEMLAGIPGIRFEPARRVEIVFR